MKYINTKTGAIVDSPCVISGDNWVTEEPLKVIAKEETIEEAIEEIEELQEPVKEIEENIEDFEGITTKEIKQELDAFGIKYNPRAKKQELYDLMIKGR